MSPTRWHPKRLSIAAIGILILYILLSSGYHNYQIDSVVPESRPEDLWQYVADFRRMRQLNPTVLEFKVTSDTGNHQHWRYSIEYHEMLSHWPYWKSKAYGDYSVIKPLPGKKEVYLIKSTHKTCFLRGLYCLRSESEFKFSPMGKDSYIVENINYQCPPFLNSACRRELEYQRKAVFDHLTTVFSKTDYPANFGYHA